MKADLVHQAQKLMGERQQLLDAQGEDVKWPLNGMRPVSKQTTNVGGGVSVYNAEISVRTSIEIPRAIVMLLINSKLAEIERRLMQMGVEP